MMVLIMLEKISIKLNFKSKYPQVFIKQILEDFLDRSFKHDHIEYYTIEQLEKNEA